MAFAPSTQRTAACFEAGSKPPSAWSMVSAASASNSGRVLPIIHSERAEPAAIDAVQPRTWNRASAIFPFSNRADSRSRSPQAGLLTSTVIAGGGSCPLLRGLRKCSSRVSECTRHLPAAEAGSSLKIGRLFRGLSPLAPSAIMHFSRDKRSTLRRFAQTSSTHCAIAFII